MNPPEPSAPDFVAALPTTRREFLRASSAAALLTATGSRAGFAAQRPEADAPHAVTQLPPHRPIHLPGLHAYADTHSVEAGQTIAFHVSSTEPFELSIFRLGPLVDDRSGDECLQRFEPCAPCPQAIHPGSYIHVEKGLREPIPSLSLECWVRPWDVNAPQGLLTQYQQGSAEGVALLLGPNGCIGFHLGDGSSPTASLLHRTDFGLVKKNRWHHVVACWNGSLKEVWIDGALRGQWPHERPWVPGSEPIRLGACAVDGVTNQFLNADLAAPTLYSRALAEAEIKQRFAQKGLYPGPPEGALACWPLSEEKGDHIADISGCQRSGRIINHGTWMIGGPSFDAARVPRYGPPYDPSQDPQRGHALRLASDDLYDCRWRPTHHWQVPANAKSGIYIARIRFSLAQKTVDYPVTFVVRSARARPKAPILVLCSTSTWLAYNSSPFCEPIPPGSFIGTGGHKGSPAGAPAYSCYRNHHAGQPAYQFGTRMPWPAAGPELHYSPSGEGYSHLMRAERFLHVWLDQSGYAYDVVTDLDLHRNPGLLEGYRTLILNGHSEYWSAEASQGLDSYLQKGGSAVVLSGNTMFWRTSFSPDGSVMECRKLDARIGGRTSDQIGELFHSHDKRRGSLLRECGLPAWKIIGLDCLGWGGATVKSSGIYEAETPDHFLFKSPETIALSPGESFGHGTDPKTFRAVGHEWDVRLSRLLALTKTVPPGAELPEEPGGMVTLALGRKGGGGALDYFTNPVPHGGVIAEMIYWERPSGGKVFNAGAIGAGWAVSVDPKLQALLRNVLHHFGIPKPHQA